MTLLQNPRLLDKCRAAYRRQCRRDPSLPPLLPAAGKIQANGSLRVVLPTADGEVTYVAAPAAGWRFTQVTPPSPTKVPPAATLEFEQLKQKIDHALEVDLEQLKRVADTVLNEALNKLADLERRLNAYVAKHPYNNAVNNIAAE